MADHLDFEARCPGVSDVPDRPAHMVHARRLRYSGPHGTMCRLCAAADARGYEAAGLPAPAGYGQALADTNLLS